MANRSRPKRVAFDVDEDTWNWLQDKYAEDQINTSARLRTLIDLARHDADIGPRVAARRSELAREERKAKEAS